MHTLSVQAFVVTTLLLVGLADHQAPAAEPGLHDPAATIRWASPTTLVIGSTDSPDETGRVVEEIDAETGNRRRLDGPAAEKEVRHHRDRNLQDRRDRNVRHPEFPDAPPLPAAAAALAGPYR